MKRYLNIFLLSSLTFLTIGCSNTPAVQENSKNSTEMYVWNPPDEYELEMRRQRQKMLDGVSKEIDILYLKQQGLYQQSQTFDDNLKQSILKTESFERDLQVINLFQKKQQQQLRIALDQLNISHKLLKSRLVSLEAMRFRPKKFSQGDYTAAIRYLRDGKLKQSMHKFNVALHSNPPGSIKDNIHFGLATVFHKLRKYSKAIKHLESIRKNFPKGDKWYMSHIMLGIIHNIKGEKSRALYILNQALEKNPPDSIKRTIDLMMNKIQEESGHVPS